MKGIGKFGTLAAILAMSGMNGGGNEFDRVEPHEIDSTPKQPPIPKGCKEYVFKESFGTLKVFAINEKSAMKKYNKWCAANSKA